MGRISGCIPRGYDLGGLYVIDSFRQPDLDPVPAVWTNVRVAELYDVATVQCADLLSGQRDLKRNAIGAL
jgi:hypothetical protein